MPENVESTRIVDITDAPEVTNSDYVVIDGKHGTRKVPIKDLLVKHGIDNPASDYGVKGMIYLKLSGASISSVWYKLYDDEWVNIL